MAMDETLCQQVKHLYEIEGLNMRQITKRLGIGKKRVSRIIKKGMLVKKASDTIMKPYERLIWEW
jgi:DNA-directed RNA polymerase specialized sigma subunit